MAAIPHTIRPGGRFHAHDFYYEEDLDDAVLRTITEESSLREDVNELDDETALAIAIQESLESAKIEEFQRSFDTPLSLSQSSTLVCSTPRSDIPFPVESTSSPSSDSAPFRRPRQRHRHSPVPSLTSNHSTGSSLRISSSSSTSSSSASATPLADYTSNVNSGHSYLAKSSARSSRYADFNLDEMARLSRRSSMAAATKMLRRTLSQRFRDGPQTLAALPVVAPQTDLFFELSDYEPLFFPKHFPACSRCGGQITAFSSSTHETRSINSSFKLHSCLRVVCSVPECGQIYCRGCFQPFKANCPAYCFSDFAIGSLCPTASCCDLVRTIGVFDTLRYLEECYLTSIQSTTPVSSSQNASSGNLVSSQWEERAEGIFNLLASLLSFPSSANEGEGQFWGYIAPLLEVSLLRHILSTLLQNASVKLWVTHSDLYLSILKLLRVLTDSPERRVRSLFMDSPGASNSTARSVSALGPDYGISRWARERVEVLRPESSSNRARGKGKQHPPQAWSIVYNEQSQQSLYSVIEGLDAHRMALIDMKNRINFPPTVEKLWGLADGLMYLVLQGLLFY